MQGAVTFPRPVSGNGDRPLPSAGIIPITASENPHEAHQPQPVRGLTAALALIISGCEMEPTDGPNAADREAAESSQAPEISR